MYSGMARIRDLSVKFITYTGFRFLRNVLELTGTTIILQRSRLYRRTRRIRANPPSAN